MSFWIFLEIFLGCWNTSYKWFGISCMSVSLFVCLLPYWNKTKWYLQFWMRYLSGLFLDLPKVLVHCIQKNQISFYVCQSSSWHTSLLKSNNFGDSSSSGWDIFLNFYWHILGMFVHMFQINPNSLLKFLKNCIIHININLICLYFSYYIVKY